MITCVGAENPGMPPGVTEGGYGAEGESFPFFAGSMVAVKKDRYPLPGSD